MPVEKAIGKNIMKPEVEAKCCYAHPELLEVNYGDN